MKSAATKAREGNRSHRPIEFGPEFSPIDAKRAPYGLSEPARKLWRDLAPEFTQKQLLNVATAPLFRVLCAVYGEFWIANEELAAARKGSQDIAGPLGRLTKAAAAFGRLASKFGMSPQDRERVSLPGQAHPARGRQPDGPGVAVGSGDSRPRIQSNHGNLLM
jgi:phage terminase small subunit